MPTSLDVRSLAPALAAAAQVVYDAWEQDEHGMDPELGAGGICDGVAEAMVGILDAEGIECASQYVEADTHVEVVARLDDGVYRIDIPARVYETGFGYVWRKVPGVTITADDVAIDRLSSDPESYSDFLAE